ncbi:MAG: hypothetical protein R6U93_03430 [Dehalococcoidia bacterium]
MSTNIFDLEAVRDLIVEQRPPAVIVLDTSIPTRNPDFGKWNASLGEVIFVLPTIVNVEWEGIKRRNKEKKGLDPASEAIRAYRDLCRKGVIHRGIHLDGIGWFVSVPFPPDDRVAPALKQWGVATRAYGSPDLMFLLLTAELADLSIAPVVLATRDNGLFGLASGSGIPAYYFECFPMTDLGATLANVPPPAGIDFRQLVSDIRQEAEKKKTIKVALVLASRREIPRSFGRDFEQWLEDSPLPESPLLFAEGTGTVDGAKAFSWGLSYSEWDYPFIYPAGGDESDPRPEFLAQAYVDFGAREGEVSNESRKALEDALETLTFPLAGWLGMPTILGPESIIKFFLYITYLEESLSSKGGSEDDVKGEFAEEYQAASNLADFGSEIVFWRLGLEPEQNKVGDSLRKLLVALTASWSIGERVTIEVAV